MRYLLDTCALSELLRPKPDAGLIEWLSGRSEQTLFISAVSVAEIAKGIHKAVDARRRQRIREWLDDELKPRFRERLLVIDEDVAEVWGEVCGLAAQRGEPLPVMDAWIAATAIARRQTVVTRNAADLERCGAAVLNPWSG